MAGETATQNSNAAATQELWSTPENWVQSSEFQQMLAREFPDDADSWTDPVSRRHFMTIMGASIALAGLAGCSPRPASQRKIVAHTKQPEGTIQGVPLYFASTAVLGGVGTGVLVKSYEGRPIKMEGNPDHPGSGGGTSIFTQAAVLGLYDPDRSQAVTYQGAPRTWDEAVSSLRGVLEKLKDKSGAGVRILSGTVTSPTLADLIGKFRKDLPKSVWTQYEPLARDNVREGSVRALGDVYSTTYEFDEAKVVLALDCDFLTAMPGSERYARDFGRTRRARKHHHADGGDVKHMSRLYSVEPMLTPTGAIADHRLALKAAEVEGFARALAAELKVSGVPAAGAVSERGKAWLTHLAKDLLASMGQSVVVVGDHQPASLHALVHAINDKLQNVGKTVKYSKPIEASTDSAKAKFENHHAELRTLVADMAASKVELLLILGANPVYSTPTDIDFAGALSKVPQSVHLGLYADETANLCKWHLPEAHTLESWGDARAFDGTASIIQPLIAPLFAGRSAIELLAALVAKPEKISQAGLSPKPEEIGQSGHDVVRGYWKEWYGKHAKVDDSEFEGIWQTWLRDGVIANSSKELAIADAPKLLPTWAGKSEPATVGTGIEINFRADPTIYDGRFANNGWLQELPKPITKLCWENAVILSPKTAKTLGLSADPRWTAGERGRMEVDIVEVGFRGKTVKAPAWIQPGHADDAITVYLGYGREHAGKVGSNIGFNAYKLRTSDTLWIGADVKITKTGDTTFIANTQAFFSMENRKPVRRVNSSILVDIESKDPETAKKAEHALDEAMAPPAAASERDLIKNELPGPNERSEVERKRQGLDHGHDHDHPHEHKHEHKHDKRLTPLTMYPDTVKEGHRWAMTIDLSSCIGCNACMIACMAENNIPVIGKHEVTRGREMYWIRVDRYHEGNPENGDELKTYFQPVPCQQCEKAPCEVVCPVGATVHSTDGLNDMVYNRCVGTRYCSNNCPYKVRRFNFLTFADWTTESLKLGRNPDVTVRSRGVMEKCTYCVQRIRTTEIIAEREFATRKPDDFGRPRIADHEIMTACEGACPTRAIVFGDLSDRGSEVRRWKDEPTNYGLLAELNTMPRTTYLAAVRNPNPEMPKGA